MKKKRLRIILKLPGDKFVEMLNARPHGDKAFIEWVPGTGKHITMIIEKGSISSHLTDESKKQGEDGRSKNIGRLDGVADIDVDELIQDALKKEELSEDEYDSDVYIVNKRFLEIVGDNSLEEIEEEDDEEIRKYLDLSSVFDKAERVRDFLKFGEVVVSVCKARDLLEMPEDVIGLDKDQLTVMAHEGKLLRFDANKAYTFEEGHPWSKILRPLGIFEITEQMKRVLIDRIKEALDESEDEESEEESSQSL